MYDDMYPHFLLNIRILSEDKIWQPETIPEFEFRSLGLRRAKAIITYGFSLKDPKKITFLEFIIE